MASYDTISNLVGFGIAGIRGRLRRKPSAISTVLVPHIVFALCLIVPFIVLCAFIGRQWVASEQVRSDTQITQLADTIAEELNQYIVSRTIILQILAASPSFERNELSSVRAQARRLLDDRSTGLLLRDGSGRVLSYSLPQSTHTLTTEDFADLPVPSPGVQSQVSELIGRGNGFSTAVVIEVPVIHHGSITHFIGVILMSPVFDALFSNNGIVGHLMGTIVDKAGRVVARSIDSHTQTGELLRSFSERVGIRGLWFGLGSGGVPLRVAYRRLPAFDLLVSVGITQEAFLRPVTRTFWSVGALALALILGSFILSAPHVKYAHIAHRTLRETAELLSLAQEAAGAAIWDWDIKSGSVTLSLLSAGMHGLATPAGADQTVTISTKEWEARVFEEDLPAIWREVNRAIVARTGFNVEFRTHAAGHESRFCWIQSSGRVVFDEIGRPRRLIGLHFDVTGRREMEEALRRSTASLQASEERLMLALDSGDDGLFDWNIVDERFWVSERWRTKLGFPASQFCQIGEWIESVHPDDQEAFAAQLERHFAGLTRCLDIEYRRSCGDGRELWVLARGRVTSRGSEGRPLRMVGTLIDITLRKEAENKIAHMAQHDALTNLPNRNLFNQQLEEQGASSSLYAVLACDLDCFKAVNDTFGHLAGDRLLCLVARRISTIVRGQDCVARLGGDEFAVILKDVADEAAARQTCERIIAAIGELIIFDGNAINIGISIGVALVSGENLDSEQVFRRADTALYQAKAAGRNTYRLYEAESHARIATRSWIALDMKDAFRRGDFSLVYQPVIDITTDRVASFEALMRWNHPERGSVSPAEFIPVAEETGLIVPLGAWALIEACCEAMRWPDDVRVAVNVSAIQFNGDLEKAVLDALGASGLPVGRLKLEVTESLLMRNPEQAFATLHRLRTLGVRIALDDFGTGYSSLSYLRRFPFDKLKIDRTFVRDIADPDAAAIVRAVVGIGERLGMGVVAEGVETMEQLDIVRREGCTEVQGFLFSKPLLPNDARAFVINRHLGLVA